MVSFNKLYPNGFNANKILAQNETVDHIGEFLSAVQTIGIVESIDTSGELVRFKTPDDKGTKKTGWYVFHYGDEFSAGAFGDWRSGEQSTWSSHSFGELDPDQQARHKRHSEELKAAIEQKQKAEYEAAAIKANEIIINSECADKDGDYLIRKQIEPIGIRQSGNKLIVPIRDGDGNLQSIQYIYPDGRKQFLTGGKIKGGRIALGKPTHTIYICEGYSTGATIHAATGDYVVCCMNAGNMGLVAEDIRQRHVSARIIVTGDNDQFLPEFTAKGQPLGNVGAKKAKSVALKINAEFNLPEFENLTTKPTDFNDLLLLEGLDAVKRQLLECKSRLNIRSISEIGFVLKPTEWLIKDILEAQSLAALYGPPGTYKTFVALDWCLSLVSGIDWQEFKVLRKHNIVYVNGEGQSGIMRRIIAWSKEHDKSKEDLSSFYLSEKAASLFEDVSELEIEISGLNTKIDLIVFDTLSRNTPGVEENSNKDMAKTIQNIDKIKGEHGCSVLLLHHTPITNDGRMRGASALLGAIDAAYCLAKEPLKTVVELTNSKMKDAEQFAPVHLASKLVTLNNVVDNEDSITSLVLEKVKRPPKLPKMGNIQLKIFNAIRDDYAIKKKSMDMTDIENVRVDFDLICTELKITKQQKSDVKKSLVNNKTIEFSNGGCRPLV